MAIWLLSLALLAPVEATFDDPAGLPAGWTTAGGRWAVDSGRLVQSSLSARGAYAWLTTSAWGDVDVSTRFRPHSTGSGVRAAGLVFRATDSRHGYYVHFDAANSQVILVRQSAEQSWHELARRGGIPIALDAWHEGRVVVRGALIEVFLDGREVASAEDATYTAGYVGLRAGQGIIAFDHLRVDGKPAACAPFEVTMDPNDLSGLPRVVVQDSVAVAGQGYFPVMVTLPDGSLGAVVRGGAPHVGRAGRLDWLRSTDGGLTWSAPTLVVDGAWDDRNPAVGVMANGDVVCAYAEARSYDAAGKFDHRAGSYLARFTISRDHGATWSAPRVMAPGLCERGSPYGRIIVLPDGTALQPVYGWPAATPAEAALPVPGDGGRSCFLLRSRDHGQTWGDSSVVAVDATEMAVERLTDGRLLAACRGLRGGLSITESADNGRTWTAPVPVAPDQVHPADLLALDADTVLMVTGCRLEPKGVLAMLSDDGGRTFPRERWAFLADDALNGDCGYPSVQRAADGTLVVVWYAVGTGRLAGVQARAVRFTEAALRRAVAR